MVLKGSWIGDAVLWHLVLWWQLPPSPVRCPKVEASIWGGLWQWLQCPQREAGLEEPHIVKWRAAAAVLHSARWLGLGLGLPGLLAQVGGSSRGL